MHAIKVIIALICVFVSTSLVNKQILQAISKRGAVAYTEIMALALCITYLVWFFWM